MDSHGLLPERLMDDTLPLVGVIMVVALVVLPAVTFGIARKWGTSNPEISTGALGGAVVVSIVGILSATFLALAILGWVPPLNELMGQSGG